VSAEQPPAKPVSPSDVPVTKKPAAAQAKIDATVEAGRAAGRGAQEAAVAVDKAAAKPVPRGPERRVRKEPATTGPDRRTAARREGDVKAQLDSFKKLVEEHPAPELLLDETKYGFSKDPRYKAIIDAEAAKRPVPDMGPKELARKEAVQKLKKQHEALKARKADKAEDPAKVKARRKQAKIQVERMDSDFDKLYTRKGSEVPLDSLARRNEFAKRAGLTERSQGSYAKLERGVSAQEASIAEQARIYQKKQQASLKESHKQVLARKKAAKAKPAVRGPENTVLARFGKAYLRSRKQNKPPPPDPKGVDVSGLKLEIDTKLRESMVVLKGEGGAIDPQTGARLTKTLKKSAAAKRARKSAAVTSMTGPEAGETAGVIKKTLGEKVKDVGQQLDDLVSQRFNNVRRVDEGAADVFTRAEAAENHGVMRTGEVLKGLKHEMGRKGYNTKRHDIVKIYMEEAARDLDTKGMPHSYPRLEK